MPSCENCDRKYPSYLLNEMAIGDDAGLHYHLLCPLCALEIRNSMHGLPPETLFHAEQAADLHKRAVRHLQKTGQPLEMS